MKRREFVAAGLAGLGAVSVGSSALASTSEGSASFGSSAAGAASASSWDGQVRVRGAQPVTVTPEPDASGRTPMHVTEDMAARRAELAAELTVLVAPLRGGSPLDAAVLREVYVDEWGTGVALVESENGRLFRLDICRRDGEVAEPLARTSNYEVYVRNGADGSLPSDREVVLAARALAGVIGANEQHSDVALVSKQRYWQPDFFG